jgi:hypothetical protein
MVTRSSASRRLFGAAVAWVLAIAAPGGFACLIFVDTDFDRSHGQLVDAQDAAQDLADGGTDLIDGDVLDADMEADVTTDADVDTGLDAPDVALDTADTAPDGDVDEADLEADVVEPCRPSLPFDVCGDCLDNDCDGEIDGDDCVEGLDLVVTTGLNPSPAGYSVSLELDHAGLVSSTGAAPDGSDLLVTYYASTDDGFAEGRPRARVVDPESDWNRVDTRLWFPLRDFIPAESQWRGYAVLIDEEAGAPLEDEDDVFLFADFFERPNAADPGNDWIVTEAANGTSGDVDLFAGALRFNTTADLDNRPIADHAFPAVIDGVVWRMGMNWQPNGSDERYRLHLQLGDSEEMSVPSAVPGNFSNQGVGPSLVWASADQGMTDENALGYEVGGALTQVDVVDGPAVVRVSVVLAGPTPSYSIFLDGDLVASRVELSTAVEKLDQVRLLTWQVDDAAFASRAFDFLIVRRLVAPEPRVSIARGPGCE